MKKLFFIIICITLLTALVLTGCGEKTPEMKVTDEFTITTDSSDTTAEATTTTELTTTPESTTSSRKGEIDLPDIPI